MSVSEEGVHAFGCSGVVGGDIEMSSVHRVSIRPPERMLKSVRDSLKETLFPDDPFKQFKNQPAKRKFLLGVRYFFPILEWAPRYSLKLFRSDLISGITIASLAIPQGISYAKLANLPPIVGLYSCFVPPLIYAVFGSSRDIALGTVAIASIILGSSLSKVVSPTEDPELYFHLALTTTLFAGIFEAGMGIFRLGFIIDFLSHPTIVGFMGGTATVVSLQQLKGVLGLKNFTKETDIVSVMRSIWGQTDKWQWETIVLGIIFLCFLLVARYISKRRSRLFWISALAPLTCVIVGTLVAFATHAEKRGVDIVGHLKSGLNPVTISDFVFDGKYLKTVVQTALISGLVTLSEGIAIGRSFGLINNYHIDGNKEMIAIGMMNIIGPCFSCYLTTGVFSRSAVNFNAGCKTVVSNIVMAIGVMLTLLFLTPLFHYTPLVVLSSIIISAMLGLIDIAGAYHLWQVDKIDFLVCMGAFFGVVFGDIEIGLITAVVISILRLILNVSRPRTVALGNIPNTTIYRDTEQYTDATRVPGIIILRIDSPIYFANSNYLRERLMRWIEDEKDLRVNEDILHYVILDMSSVPNIDTSGIRMLQELKKNLDNKHLQLALANPGVGLMEKFIKAKFTEFLGQNWLFLTISEGVTICNSFINDCKSDIDDNNEGGDKDELNVHYTAAR
ncbi:hypothetical protein SUGI_0793960 [Cryptomeria japonica]|nr:hypothetical protein SUGI_0793960 [Cryptomeria japonica]